MATPFGGPAMVSPRQVALPEEGVTRPAMIRSKVDLPEPERPSRPTISPERIVRSTFSSTSSSSPLPFGKDRQTPRISMSAEGWSSMMVSSSAEPQAAFAEGIERPPDQAIEQRHQDAHRGDSEHDARKVAGLGCGSDVGAEPGGLQVR